MSFVNNMFFVNDCWGDISDPQKNTIHQLNHFVPNAVCWWGKAGNTPRTGHQSITVQTTHTPCSNTFTIQLGKTLADMERRAKGKALSLTPCKATVPFTSASPLTEAYSTRPLSSSGQCIVQCDVVCLQLQIDTKVTWFGNNNCNNNCNYCYISDFMAPIN